MRLVILLKSNKADKMLPGGKAEGKDPKDFCPIQMKKGIRIEMEHTNDKKIAQRIVMDHLVENAKYYSYLERMEKKMLKSFAIELGRREEDSGIKLHNNGKKIRAIMPIKKKRKGIIEDISREAGERSSVLNGMSY